MKGTFERATEASEHGAEGSKPSWPSPCSHRSQPDSEIRGAALTLYDRRWDLIGPLQHMADNLGLPPYDWCRPSVTLGKPAAEFVDGRFRIDVDSHRVGAHVCAREDAGRPAGEVVALHRFPHVDTDFGLQRYAFEGDASLHADSLEIRPD